MSSIELVAAYLRERARLRLIVPLAIVLAATGWCLGGQLPFDAWRFALASTAAVAIVLAFRVWDDLEDRAVDRRRHPHRVMATSSRVAPFVALISALVIASVGLLIALPALLPRLIAVAIAAVILSAWYGVRPSENWNVVVGGHLVLSKYPLIAYAVAPVIPQSVWQARPVAILLALYLVACIYEYADDSHLRQAALVLFSRSTQP